MGICLVFRSTPNKECVISSARWHHNARDLNFIDEAEARVCDRPFEAVVKKLPSLAFSSALRAVMSLLAVVDDNVDRSVPDGFLTKLTGPIGRDFRYEKRFQSRLTQEHFSQ